MRDGATPDPLGASFRDPSGFVFVADGVLYRQVHHVYRPHYDRLMESGLYEALVNAGTLVRHEEVVRAPSTDPAVYRWLAPERIPYISYPYEWCFSQLRDAALLTLDIQLRSLSHGMTLKDASAYNVQFVGSRPIFIDTLSFEIYEEGVPWVAYRQFCQHFLAPLALMSHVDGRTVHLLRHYLDGIPLDLAAALLPARTRLRPGLLMHIHAHARTQRRHQDDGRSAAGASVPRLAKSRLVALIENLRRVVEACKPPRRATEWSDYYSATNYSADAMSAKESAVLRLVEAYAAPGELVHDLGANTGRFSRLLAGTGRYVVAHDVDDMAVERNYLTCREQNEAAVLPLVLDLTNPSPAAGWALEERSSALDRISNSTVIALALIHHLAIANNVPLDRLADFFARLARTLIIEFVPKEDSQVQRLLATRQDIFPGYHQEGFEAAFGRRFDIVSCQPIESTVRTLYAMRRAVRHTGQAVA